MDTTLTQNIEGVTITYAMMVLTIGVALFVELAKVILTGFAWFTDDLRKPLLPLLSIAVTMAVFRATGQSSWLLGGVILGWSASGGYSWVAGILETVGLKSRPILPIILILCGVLFVAGCTDKILTPAEQLEFAMFNIRVQDWNEQCLADPNQCAQGLSNMAAEMQAWVGVIVGEPNSLGVTP